MAARILVVDDEQLMTAMVATLLSTEGYDVIEASDGSRAMAILGETTPDVILCDLAMPGMDGFEILQHVRKNPRLRHIPFAMVTAHGEIENRMEALQLGADDFILKPFNTAELVSKVSGLVAKVNQARELSRTAAADLAGDLSEVALTDVFHILELSRKTGRIRVKNGELSGDVWFAEGQPVHAEGDGWVGDDALLRFLTWRQGSFRFASQETSEERSTTTSTHDVLVQGVKFLDALDEWWGKTVQTAHDAAAAAIVKRHGNDLCDRDRKLLAEIDGRRTLADIADSLKLERFDAFMSLRTLVSLGLVIGDATEDEVDPLGLLLDHGGGSDADRERVLVIDGSAPYRQSLVGAINASLALQAIGAVSTGDEALTLIHDRDPAVVTLDLNLPDENGLSLLKRIMVQQPRPVVVVSALTQEGSMSAFECLRYGAVDFMPKPASVATEALQEQQSALVEKVRRAAAVNVRNIRRVRLPRSEPGTESHPPVIGANRLVAAGGGVGGIGALIRFVAGLPTDLAAPVLVVQHLMDATLDAFVDYLSRYAVIPVRRAENNAPLEAGVCHIACSDDYVNLEPARQGELPRLRVGARPALFQSSQTINWAFFSVAETYGDRVVCVILAGQTDDGSKGAAEIVRMGGRCVVQDPNSCVAAEMPRAAIEVGVAGETVPDGAVAAKVVELLRAAGSAGARG